MSGVQIWFLGRLCRAEGEWVSAEYMDGHLYQPGFWQVNELIDLESDMDVWSSIQRSAELSEDEYDTPSDEIWGWLNDSPPHWTEDPDLCEAVHRAFHYTKNQQEKLLFNTFSHDHNDFGDLI